MRKVRSSCRLTRCRANDAGVAAVVRAVHRPEVGAAALSVPSPEHYLPLLYTAALREPQDDMEIFNDELAFGSISMTSVLIG